ncbi:MAG: ferric reductase-like transmembrane domain-containing protein [Tannerella sp.]|jgi:DMSO/TMAO reductase YedYZ heme-binding membrane subunit|nr:ferric reductase-like transmembrane domain-containing protein [Tannerella sp.]
MIKLLIDLLSFLRSCAPLLTSLVILTLLCILLSKSIKKHATLYYIVLAIPFALIAIPFTGRLMGFEIESFVRIPFLGEIIRDYIHMGTFGHPLLIIIMYMGALDPKKPYVKNLLSIRRELSIISGFAVFAHSLVRVVNNLPDSLKFFTNHADYMANTKVASELGAGISSFSFVLGIVMLILFIPLWVTSFGSIRKRMEYARWKQLQKWSYVLYATLFIHAVCIQTGGLMNPRGGHAPRPAAVETAIAQNQTEGRPGETARPADRQAEQKDATRPPEGGRNGRSDAVKSAETGRQSGQTAGQVTSGRMPTKGFSDIQVSALTRGTIHLLTLCFIYGSYTFLRLRKAGKDRKKKSGSGGMNA